jgi:choline-glycine betaine transporter
MSEKTKVFIYTLILLALFISWSVYSNQEKESCESSGGVYARQNIGWSFECRTNSIEVEP